MSKGGSTTRTVTSQTGAPEYAQPFLEFGLSEAKELYGQPQQFYPGATTVGFSPESEMALGGLRQQAITGSPFIGAVQDVVMQNLTGTNPLMAAAFRPAIEAVQAEASKAGRYGSGYQQAALTQALAPMAYQAQQTAIAQAPGARQFGQADLQTLAQVGAAREAQDQAELASNMQRFQFEQEAPRAALADYMATVAGGTVGGQTMQPVYRQPALSALSGAMGGAQLGSMLAGPGGAVNPAFAIGGGLLGLA
jgi:hypothetical protein